MDEKMIENVKGWYFGGTLVPQINSVHFGAFAAKGYGLITEVATLNKTKIAPEYIVDADSPSAYYDRDNNKIALPGWYMLADRVGLISHSDKDLNIFSLALINGSTIHETLHAVHTTKTMKDLIELVKNRLGEDSTPANMIGSVVNILEDIRIESLDLSHTMKFWLISKNDILFNDDEVGQAFEKFDGSLQTGINVAACYKRIALRDRVSMTLPKAAADALKRMVGGRSLVSTISAAVDFILAFDRIESDESSSTPSGSDGEGEGDEFEGASSAQNSGEEIETAPVSGKDSKKIESVGKAFKAATKEGKKEFEAAVSAKEAEDAVKKLAKVNIVQIGKMDRSWDISRGPAVTVKGSNRFAQELKQLRTQIVGKGLNKKSGAKVDGTGLYRIATDGKIFAKKGEIDTGHENLEVVVLVDASGSMNSGAGRVGYVEGDPYISLFELSVGVAKKVFVAMKTAGIASMVLAHTGDNATHTVPTLINVASNNMDGGTTSNIERAFNQMNSLALNENYDGAIINEIVKGDFFNKESNTTKVLIVLSDGSPSGSGYTGSAANTHTKNAIKQARLAGVKVVCLSLVSHVVDSNDRIYGEEFNHDATKDLDGALTKMVRSLATGGKI